MVAEESRVERWSLGAVAVSLAEMFWKGTTAVAHADEDVRCTIWEHPGRDLGDV